MSSSIWSQKYTLVGSYLQKCTALIFMVMLPVLFVWVFFGYDLICLILPDKETAKLSAVYLQYVAFGIPAYILLNVVSVSYKHKVFSISQLMFY